MVSEQRWDLAAAKVATKWPGWPPCAVLQPGATIYKIKSILCTSGRSEGSCQTLWFIPC